MSKEQTHCANLSKSKQKLHIKKDQHETKKLVEFDQFENLGDIFQE